MKFVGDDGYFASIKSIQIKSTKNQEFSYIKNTTVKNNQEVVLRDNCKVPRTTIGKLNTQTSTLDPIINYY